jgi:hypothetical protein
VMKASRKTYRWKVHGLDRHTGEARSVLANGSTEEAARNHAADLGVVVESISCLSNHSAPAERPKRPKTVRPEHESELWSIAKKIFIGYGIFVSVLVLTAILIFAVFMILLIVILIIAIGA